MNRRGWFRSAVAGVLGGWLGSKVEAVPHVPTAADVGNEITYTSKHYVWKKGGDGWYTVQNFDPATHTITIDWSGHE